MTLQRLARWSAALALTASFAWAQEPTSEAAGTGTPPAEQSSTTQAPPTTTGETPKATGEAPKADAAPAADAAPTPPAPAAAPAAPADTGRVLIGRIIDTKSKDPLPAATVSIKGTSLRATVDGDGRFSLPGVPVDAFTLQVAEQDHQHREVKVNPGVRSITVELSESYVEEMVVVGRATEVSRKNLANAVSTVSSQDIQKAPAQTLDAALQGKVAGANIQANSGAPGGGLQIKLRGVSTINAMSTPLYVIDGVIVSDAAISNGIHALTKSNAGSNPAPVQDDQVNRIADLNPSDIANVEILKGGSAAAIYGSKASNGVVIITTKKGRAGSSEPRVELSQRLGTYQLEHEIGMREYKTLDEARAVWGSLADQYWTGKSFDHEKELAGRTDPSTETYASISGATNDTTYFGSALVKSDKGIIIGTGYDKQGVRLNLGHRFSDALELNVSSNVVHSLARRGLSNNDNANVSHYMVFASTPSFINLLPDANGVYPKNPFIGGNNTNPLQTAALMTNDEDVWRLITSTDALWKVWSNADQELKLAANLGVDRFQQKNTLLFPPSLYFEPADDGLDGTSLFGTHENLNTNFGANLIHIYRPTNGWLNSLTTSAGVQQESRDLDSTYITTRNFVQGLSNIDSGTQVGVEEQRQRALDRGAYVQEEVLALDQRLQVVGAVRAEQSSLNGDPHAFYVYPKVAASYRIPGLPSMFEELKVRAAYGETGNLPLYGMKFTDLRAQNIEGIGGVLLLPGSVLGNPNVKPERQQEFEAGVDSLLFNGTMVVELTAYRRNITDLLLQRAVAPSTGFQTEIFNGGAMSNSGVEAMLQVTPVQQDTGLTWTSRTTFALNRSRIEDLNGLPAFSVGGFGVSLGAFRIEKGASATQIVGNAGIDPVTGLPIVKKIGDAEPDFRMGFINDFKYGPFSLATNLDWQQGSKVINLTRFLWDLTANTPDYTTAGEKRLEDWSVNKLTSAYVEDATFLKIREVTISYDLPPSLFQGYFKVVRNAKVSVSGRNLWTFTKYSGLDPEVSNFGNQSIARNIDVAPFPPSRSFWGSIELGF
jgi:TonB-dependent starch-binding outer membrane protein SusC